MDALRPERDFADFLAQGQFMIQRERASGRYVFFPRVAEPASGSEDLQWVKVSGRGSVYSTTTVRNKPPVADYNVALIDLAEGVRMMGRVTGVDPGTVRIGMAVTARIGEIDGVTAILWEPSA